LAATALHKHDFVRQVRVVVGDKQKVRAKQFVKLRGQWRRSKFVPITNLLGGLSISMFLSNFLFNLAFWTYICKMSSSSNEDEMTLEQTHLLLSDLLSAFTSKTHNTPLSTEFHNKLLQHVAAAPVQSLRQALEDAPTKQ
jgi:hypothetical protein